MTMNENLGKLGKDKVTGFAGMITGYCQYLTGCNQYLLAPTKLKKDGSLNESIWFDVKRVTITGKGIAQSEVSDNGGPQMDSPGRQA